MEIGIIIFLIVALIIVIWAILGLRQMKQKFFTFFLIALILFIFLSFIIVFKGKNLSVHNVSDIGNAAKIYFSWLLNIFDNVKTVTADVIKMNWVGNSTT